MKPRTRWNSTALAYWLDRHLRALRDLLWAAGLVGDDPSPSWRAFWLREGQPHRDGADDVWVNLPNCAENDARAADAYLMRITERKATA